MGNVLSHNTEGPANEGPGINLKLLKEMILPPPIRSQHERSRASTRMNSIDESDVYDNAPVPLPGPGTPISRPRQLQEKVLAAPTPFALGVTPARLREPAARIVTEQLFPPAPRRPPSPHVQYVVLILPAPVYAGDLDPAAVARMMEDETLPMKPTFLRHPTPPSLIPDSRSSPASSVANTSMAVTCRPLVARDYSSSRPPTTPARNSHPTTSLRSAIPSRPTRRLSPPP